MDNDIFVTRTELKNDINKISLNKLEIINSIPFTATDDENTELCNTHTEWRWRIFKLPNKQNEFIEISYKNPGGKRLFINKNGQWIESNMSTEYDKYIVEQYYDYTK